MSLQERSHLLTGVDMVIVGTCPAALGCLPGSLEVATGLALAP